MLLDDLARTIDNLARRIRALETREPYIGYLSSTGAFYLGNPSVDGTWRITRSGNNLVTERREVGVWVIKDTITP